MPNGSSPLLRFANQILDESASLFLRNHLCIRYSVVPLALRRGNSCWPSCVSSRASEVCAEAANFINGSLALASERPRWAGVRVQDFTGPVNTLGFILFVAGRYWRVVGRKVI